MSAEELIGGITSPNMKKIGKALRTKGYGLYATTNRIVGVKGGVRQWASEEVEQIQTVDELQRKMDFEVRKPELIEIRIQREKSALKRWGLGHWYNIIIRSATDTHRIGAGKKEGEFLKEIFTTFDKDKFIAEDL